MPQKRSVRGDLYILFSENITSEKKETKKVFHKIALIILSVWGASPTGTSNSAKTVLFLDFYVSSYVENRVETWFLVNFWKS